MKVTILKIPLTTKRAGGELLNLTCEVELAAELLELVSPGTVEVALDSG